MISARAARLARAVLFFLVFVFFSFILKHFLDILYETTTWDNWIISSRLASKMFPYYFSLSNMQICDALVVVVSKAH